MIQRKIREAGALALAPILALAALIQLVTPLPGTAQTNGIIHIPGGGTVLDHPSPRLRPGSQTQDSDGRWAAFLQRIECGIASVDWFGPYESRHQWGNVMTYGTCGPHSAAGYEYSIPGLDAQSGTFRFFAAMYDSDSGVPANRIYVHLVATNGERLYSFDQLQFQTIWQGRGQENLDMVSTNTHRPFLDRRWVASFLDNRTFAANRLRTARVFVANDTKKPMRFYFGNCSLRHTRNNTPLSTFLRTNTLRCGVLSARPAFLTNRRFLEVFD